MIHSMALRLVAELRSGYHKQTSNALHRVEEDSKCCLGVACWMIYQDTHGQMDNVYTYDGHDKVLPKRTRDWFGFWDGIGARRDDKDIIIDGEHYGSLGEANDAGCSFLQIADYIEANWESL